MALEEVFGPAGRTVPVGPGLLGAGYPQRGAVPRLDSRGPGRWLDANYCEPHARAMKARLERMVWLLMAGSTNLKYPTIVEDKLRNYLIGHAELGLDL